LPGKAKPGRPTPPDAALAARPAPPAAVVTPPGEPRRPPAGTLHPGKAPGLDRRTLQKLARGLLPIGAEIDLHGMTRTQAHAALVAFLGASQRGARACVRVITGHGRRGAEGAGVLRDLVPRWLNEPALRPRVLAFAMAQPRHGGHGAFYVLLKKRV
ncbi:MAG: Smr/MutS family protein, partial [Alphaproteobacteria bacterium]